MNIRIVLADDHQLSAQGFTAAQNRPTLSGREANNGEEAI